MTISIENLRKSYQQAEQTIEILKGINAEIRQKEVVAVIGQSGAGKSTLLTLLAGLDRPDSGKIRVNNTDITALSEDELTAFRGKNISIVFQQYHLIRHLTALENVCLPLEIQGRKDVIPRATALLDEVGLAHRLDHNPAQLSGGECQRVAIARALIVEPLLLLADEPSGNLDSKTGDKVMENFFSSVRKHGTTTILVTHNQALASRCDRVFRLENGQLLEQGK
ncbi:MAG: ABC transporter ATP-binding protein [Bdellovibrionaceae bacterium]|nr:ABC transporter ATP-binding protein [Pseudobdellovibrionaceae bacterium]